MKTTDYQVTLYAADGDWLDQVTDNDTSFDAVSLAKEKVPVDGRAEVTKVTTEKIATVTKPAKVRIKYGE